MAVNIDAVYQKVLALINKEQRGYLTPQDFNLLADRAQMEIFESYFHSLKNDYHRLKNNINYADNAEMDLENLHPFESSETSSVGTNGLISTLPSDLYRIKNVQREQSDGTSKEVDEVTEKELIDILNNPLLTPTEKRSIYVRVVSTLGQALRIYPAPTTTSNLTIKYFKRPTKPEWAYIVVNGKALLNVGEAVNFTLNPSEEENLVTKILELTGIIIQKPGIVEIAASQEAITKQQNN